MKNSEVCNFIKKETLAQVFSCEFCKISKNIFLQFSSQLFFLIFSGLLCNIRQNIWNKAKKLSKVGQYRKTLYNFEEFFADLVFFRRENKH